MQMGRLFSVVLVLVVVPVCGAEFVVASFNLENFVGPNPHRRQVKSPAAKAKIVEALVKIRPDVLAVQEVGQKPRAEELRALLKKAGLELPNLVFVKGPDPVINLAVFSRFELRATPHHEVFYLLGGRRHMVARGFVEVEVKVSPGYVFTLFNAHLKSKRPVSYASEAAIRLAEARALRALVAARLAAAPNRNLLVVGDLNDTQDQPPVKELMGRGKARLVDLRPAERNGDQAPSANRYPPRRVTWTTYYGKEDSFSRFDYMLASPGMARELLPSGTYVHTMPDWGIASDHRPIVATFTSRNQ